MSKLTKEDLHFLKGKLEDLERTLSKQVKELDAPPDMGSDVDEFQEKGDEVEQFGVNLGIEEVDKERLERVQEALQKIKSGSYGVCASCGRDIEIAVLKTDPESAFCERCKKK